MKKNLNNKKPTIGIIGFGNFGKLAASILAEKFDVRIYDNDKAKLKEIKIIKAQGQKLQRVAESDIVIFSAPISETENLIKKISPWVKPGALILDTCSVKIMPCQWLQKNLPKNVQIMGTHPMFGPTTSKFNYNKQKWELKGLQTVICPLRINIETYNKVYSFLRKLGLHVIETSPQEHDKQNATTLSLVHFLGRTLSRANIKEQEIFTPGYSDLLKILPHTNQDNWQLFYDMNNYNPEADKVRNNFLKAAEKIEEKIINARNKDKFAFNRAMINEIDDKIFALLKARFKYVKNIGVIKKKKGLKIVDRQREKNIIQDKIKKYNLNPEFVKKIYHTLFKESYKKQ